MSTTADLMESTQVKFKQNSPISGEFQIEIKSGLIVNQMDHAFRELTRTADIKGFRKGKVPLNVVRDRYKNQVIRNVFEQLVADTCRGAAQQEKVPVVGEPKVTRTNWLTWKEGNNMEYTAEVELLPSPKLKKYKGLSIQIDEFSVNDDSVAEQVNRMLESRAELKTVENDRGVRDNDHVAIDFVGRLGDEELPDARADNFLLEMGGPNTIPAFQEGLLGTKVGDEKEILVPYPDDYSNPEIAGKKVTYTVKLLEIKQKILPELNDELAKDFDMESADEVRNKIREGLESESNHNKRNQTEERILEALVESNPFEVPQTLVQYQLNRILQEVSQALKDQKFSSGLIEEYITKNIDESKKRAESEVKLALLLPKVVETLKFEVTDSDVDAKIEEYSNNADGKSKEVKDYYSKPENRNSLKDQISRSKAIDYMIEKSKTKVIKKK